MAGEGGRLNADEARYLTGGGEPATSSILVSSSKYLNNPLFRDLYAQLGLKRNGRDLPDSYLIPELNRAFAEVTDAEIAAELLTAERERLPEFAAWLDARFVSTFTVEDLKDYRANTLGGRVHDFLVKTGFEVDFMFRSAAEDDFAYLNKRRVQVHDIEHIVSGLDPSPVGEIGLIVANITANTNYFDVQFAAELNRYNSLLASTSLMRIALHYPAVTSALYEAICLGRRLGSGQSRPLFMMRWEDHFHRTLPEIRERLGFTDLPPQGYWDWTYEAAAG